MIKLKSLLLEFIPDPDRVYLITGIIVVKTEEQEKIEGVDIFSHYELINHPGVMSEYSHQTLAKKHGLRYLEEYKRWIVRTDERIIYWWADPSFPVNREKTAVEKYLSEIYKLKQLTHQSPQNHNI